MPERGTAQRTPNAEPNSASNAIFMCLSARNLQRPRDKSRQGRRKFRKGTTGGRTSADVTLSGPTPAGPSGNDGPERCERSASNPVLLAGQHRRDIRARRTGLRKRVTADLPIYLAHRRPRRDGSCCVGSSWNVMLAARDCLLR